MVVELSCVMSGKIQLRLSVQLVWLELVLHLIIDPNLFELYSNICLLAWESRNSSLQGTVLQPPKVKKNEQPTQIRGVL